MEQMLGLLSNRKTLKPLWIAMRRAPRDSAARRNLLRFSFSILLFAAVVGDYIYMFHGFIAENGFGQFVLVLIPAAIVWLIIFFVIARQKRDERALSSANPAVSPELKQGLFREACLLATLLERLASESYLEKEIPPEIVVTTRRVLLDRLRSLGMRDHLEPWLLDLLLAPDGHWTEEQKRRAIPALECFAAFRWTLGLSGLQELTVDPEYNLSDARSLVEIKQTEKLFVLPSWDVRPARDAASQFFHRCWAELVARRTIDTTPEQDVERALAIRAEIQEAGYTGDYLVGVRTISELDTSLLLLVTRRAYNRWQFLAVLVDVLSGDAPVERIRTFWQITLHLPRWLISRPPKFRLSSVIVSGRTERKDRLRMTLDRRAFLNAFTKAGIASPLLPGILYTLAAQAQISVPVGKTAIPESSLPKITPEMLDQATALAGIGPFTAEQKKMMLDGLNDQRAGYDKIRALKVPNSVPPAFIFHPQPAPKSVGGRVTAGDTLPQLRTNEFEGQEPKAPANIEDLAFATVLELASLIYNRKITSLALTQMYLARLKRYDAKLHFVITLTEERALDQAQPPIRILPLAFIEAQCTAFHGARKTCSP